MGGFISFLAICFAVLVINLMFNGSGAEADCGQVPGIGYQTPEDCSSNCTGYCTSLIGCENVTDPCDPNYPREWARRYPCNTCDPCNYCRDHKFYLCDEIIRFPRENINCDPCKRCSRNETEFCLSRAGTPPPPPPVGPAPSFNYCSNPYSGGNCKQTIFSNGASACFCVYCS